MELTDRIKEFAQKHKTPFLIVDAEIIKENYKKIKKSFGDIEVYYAIKANPDLKILEVIRNMGGGFEVASVKELELILKIEANHSPLISSHPVKTPEFIKLASRNGIQLFVFDSKTEIDKIAKYAPGSRVYPRLSVSNVGSEWPLAEKFGLEPENVVPLLEYAKQKELIPYGITFHVGSQCVTKSNWINALRTCSELFGFAKEREIKLELINIGGGLPIRHTHDVPSIEEIGHEVLEFVREYFRNSVRMTIEPGRAMVGNAAILVASIIGKAKRKNKNWLYLDVGVFQGLMETVGGIEYQVKAGKDESNLKEYMLAGPTCDGFDKMFTCNLPETLKVGDKIYIMDAGAYTTAYSSDFDGFEMPKIYFLE